MPRCAELMSSFKNTKQNKILLCFVLRMTSSIKLSGNNFGLPNYSIRMWLYCMDTQIGGRKRTSNYPRLRDSTRRRRTTRETRNKPTRLKRSWIDCNRASCFMRPTSSLPRCTQRVPRLHNTANGTPPYTPSSQHTGLRLGLEKVFARRKFKCKVFFSLCFLHTKPVVSL